MKLTPLPSKALGVLVLHGFTGHLQTVEGIKPYLNKHHLKYSIPVLRGHGTQFRDLNGVTYKDWVADAEGALVELAKTVDKVVVVGLSMGGLMALDLGIHYPDLVAGVVSVAAALKFANPLACLTPWISRLIPYWPSQPSYQDQEKGKRCKNYQWFPSKAFASLYDYAHKIEEELPRLRVPILILHSKKDSVIKPQAAQEIYEKVSSEHKEIKWFEKSGHEMMEDLEAKEVFQAITHFILQFVGKKKDEA